MSAGAAHVVVIGGTSGIGLASARLLAARGHAVTIVGRDPDKLRGATAQAGGSVRGEAVDAGDRPALDALFARIAPVGHLVVAASGGAGAGPFASLAADGLRRGFEAKFWVHWNAAQAVLPHLAGDGSITLVTAASSRLAIPAPRAWRRSTARWSAWCQRSRANLRPSASTPSHRA